MRHPFLGTAVLAFALLSTPSFAEDFKLSSPITILMPIVLENLDTLELSAKQLDQVRDISRKNFSQVEYLNALYHELKTQVREDTLDPEGKKDIVLQNVAKLAKLDEQRMLLTVDCAFELKQVLSAKQYQELITIQSFTQAK